MSKSFSRSVESEVGVEDVFAVLTGEHWAEQLAEHMGDDCRLVSREETAGGGVTLVLSRRLPQGIPGFLQKFLPSDPRVTTTDAWGPLVDGRRECTWKAKIDQAPARITGTQVLETTAGGNRHTTHGEVSVSVPLVGGKAESFIAEQISKLAAKHAEVVEKVLRA